MRKPPARVVFPVVSLLITLGIIIILSQQTAATTPVEQTPTPAQTLAPKIAPEPKIQHIPEETPAPTPETAPQPEIQPQTEEIPEPEETEPPTHTADDIEALAIGIYQEAGGDACSDDTRQMVGEVILNRKDSEDFPDTIQEVLTAPYQYGRLHWTGLVWPERAAEPGEAHAVERAYKCAEALLNGTVERLLPPDTVYQAEFQQGTEVVAQQDGFYFCR